MATSGGALVAINAALKAPELIDKVIADSFGGEYTLKAFTERVPEDRETSNTGWSKKWGMNVLVMCKSGDT